MKIITSLLIVTTLLSLAASTYLYLQIDQTQTSLQQEIVQSAKLSTELQSKISDSDGKMETIKGLLADQEAKLKENQSKLSTTDTLNSQQTRDLTQLSAEGKAQAAMIQVHMAEINQMKPEVAQLKVNAAVATPEIIEAITLTTKELKAKITELEASAIKSTEKVKLAADANKSMTVTTGASSSLINASSTRFDVVNIGKRDAFVVIRTGSSQDIQVGQRFIICKDDAVIAEAIVSSIKADFTVAQIVPQSIKGTLPKGCTAIVVQ
jgi:hypothetical protein